MKACKTPLKKEKLISSQEFFMDYVENYQNTCFTEHLYVAASGILKYYELLIIISYLKLSKSSKNSK